MQTAINTITQHFFGKAGLDAVSEPELQEFIGKYPYNAAARYLLARKTGDRDKLETAALYLHNPLWLDWLMQLPDEEPPAVTTEKETAPPPDTAGEQQPVSEIVSIVQTAPENCNDAGAASSTSDNKNESSTDSLLAFEPYHTIDYFASQGIRLQQAELTKDRLGQQLKSFTEWLRSMKKLPAAPGSEPVGPIDEASQQRVIRTAEASIEDKDVVTEAMAEVWIKQGQTHKARAIYQKLSLLNPDKSAYFAAKIDQLK